MQTVDTQNAGSQRPSWRKRIALAALVAGLVVAGVWVVAKRSRSTAPAPPDSMASMGAMAMPATSSPGQVSTASTELQIDLAPDDLKKAQIRIVRDAANPWYEVTLIEGRNRQIRRMFQAVGFLVEKIKRIQLGPLKLDVPPGQFRPLTIREVAQLKHFSPKA